MKPSIFSDFENRAYISAAYLAETTTTTPKPIPTPQINVVYEKPPIVDDRYGNVAQVVPSDSIEENDTSNENEYEEGEDYADIQENSVGKTEEGTMPIWGLIPGTPPKNPLKYFGAPSRENIERTPHNGFSRIRFDEPYLNTATQENTFNTKISNEKSQGTNEVSTNDYSNTGSSEGTESCSRM